MPDAHKNFAYTSVVTPPSPASSGTSLVVESGAGALFPAAPFNATIWPADELPLASNAEIVRVTDVTGDTLTITRTQESSSARAILVGDQIAATITAKALQDIETDVAGKAGLTNPTLAGYVLSASRTVNRTALVGTEIDITKPETVVSLTSSPTLTFSATPAEGYEFRLTLNADSSARTVTIPSSYSVNRQGSVTSVVVPASGTLMLLFRYTGARWEVFGDPPALPARQHAEISFDPKAICDGAVDRVFLFKVGAWAPNGINILAWSLSFEADPTTEFDANTKLKRADAYVGLANAADMDVLQTTAGVASETVPGNINSGATVANGQVIYLEFGTAYTEANHQVIFEMEYSIA